MAEKKNTQFDRPGGYAQPKGATQVQRRAAKQMSEAEIKLFGDELPAYVPTASNQRSAVSGQKTEVRNQRSEVSAAGHEEVKRRTGEQVKTARSSPLHPLTYSPVQPSFSASNPDTQLYVGDCRDVLATLPEKGHVDLIFADPPFNWDVPYDGWKDGMSRQEYERFTFDWLDGCIEALAPHGSLWVNIPDDTAAEVVLHLKRRGLTMINWCIWHFRFGQNRNSSFIMSKVHVLYFAKDAGSRQQGVGSRKKSVGHQESKATAYCPLPTASSRIWNPNDILELSDRASIYADPRTMSKDTNKGLRVPMDVWYGKYWGRIQGNNKERRHNHHNQIPEIYLERVIKACSNPVPGWPPTRGITTEIAENTEKSNSISSSVTPVSSVVNPMGEGAGFGSLVLDPFCGSGTTSTVARALGRRSITIEYSEVNAKSAWERITNVGVIPREDAGKPQSTAIFKSRRKRQPAPSM